jgi:hypothetical protein
MFMINATMSSHSVGHPCGGPAIDDTVANGTYYYYLLTVSLFSTPMLITEDKPDVFVDVDEVMLVAVAVVACIFAFVGYVIQFSFSANSSLHFSWGVIWDFASFGCQFGTEVWLLAMLIACAHANVHYLRQLSLAIVLVRTAHAFPSLFVFWRLLCVPNSVWSQQLQQPRRLAHKCGIFLLSLLALGNGMLLRYLTVVSRQQVSWIPR